MKTALVGYTGFVGSNLDSNHNFDGRFNSKNIQEAYGSRPDLLVYTAVPAAMFIANANPEEDFNTIKCAIENLKKIDAKRVVLISTVAVYDRTDGVDETHIINEEKIPPYGKNRLFLEKWVLDNCEKSLVVRLPAIYGLNLKKNFIYDFINIIPKMLNKSKFEELSSVNAIVKQNYELYSDGFYHCIHDDSKEVYEFFKNNSFNATLFTDSRSIYQFYHLERLWNDINIALKNDVRLLNITTEPVSVSEVYSVLCGHSFKNELNKIPFNYDVRSVYAGLYNGNNGYIVDKKTVLYDLKQYVDMEIEKKWG